MPRILPYQPVLYQAASATSSAAISADPEVVADRSLEDVLEIHLAQLGVPVIYGLPLGHGPHLASIPLGVTATLDADARSLTIDEPGVR